MRILLLNLIILNLTIYITSNGYATEEETKQHRVSIKSASHNHDSISEERRKNRQSYIKKRRNEFHEIIRREFVQYGPQDSEVIEFTGVTNTAYSAYSHTLPLTPDRIHPSRPNKEEYADDIRASMTPSSAKMMNSSSHFFARVTEQGDEGIESYQRATIFTCLANPARM